jgi:hypothetical protein
MVTTEYIISFSSPISEMALNLVGDIGDSYRYSDNLCNLYIEGDIDERDIIRLVAQYITVEKVGLIKKTQLFEPVWAGTDDV